jgi:hypothetical protein
MPNHRFIGILFHWKLFKAGLAYNRVLFIVLYSIFVPLMVLNAIFGGREAVLAKLMIFSVGLIGMIAGTEEVKYKYNRLEVSLPIPIRRIAVNRYPLIMFYWLSLILLLLLSHTVSRNGVLDIKFLWHTIALTGMLVSFISFMGINFDVGYCFYNKMTTYTLRTGAVTMAILCASIFILMTEYGGSRGDPFLARISFSPLGAFGLFVLGIALYVLSVSVYMRRKSFVE